MPVDTYMGQMANMRDARTHSTLPIIHTHKLQKICAELRRFFSVLAKIDRIFFSYSLFRRKTETKKGGMYAPRKMQFENSNDPDSPFSIRQLPATAHSQCRSRASWQFFVFIIVVLLLLLLCLVAFNSTLCALCIVCTIATALHFVFNVHHKILLLVMRLLSFLFSFLALCGYRGSRSLFCSRSFVRAFISYIIWFVAKRLDVIQISSYYFLWIYLTYCVFALSQSTACWSFCRTYTHTYTGIRIGIYMTCLRMCVHA